MLDALRIVRELNEAEPANSIDDYVKSLLEKERFFRTVDGNMYQTYAIAENVRTNRQAMRALSQSCAKLRPGFTPSVTIHPGHHNEDQTIH